MNLDLYEPTVVFERKGVVVNSKDENFRTGDLPASPMVDGFLADDDIQQITFCSTNFGFVYTITKKFKK